MDCQKEKIRYALQSKKDIIILDTETTGLSPKSSFIIQFAGKKYRNIDSVLTLVEETELFIKPPILIDRKIELLTGITNEFLQDKPSEEVVFPYIKDFLQDAILVIYNAPFDLRMLEAMYTRNSEKFCHDMVLDVLLMAKELIPRNKTESYKLSVIAKLYGVDKDIDFHNAFADVTATFRLFKIFVGEYFSEGHFSEKQGIKKIRVLSLFFWEGNAKNSRIYINTDKGNCYYDIYTKEWIDNNINLRMYDMEDLRKQVFSIANVTNEEELSKYKQKNGDSI